MNIKRRLEYFRGELRAGRIGYNELFELKTLVPYIEPGDVELLEAAGVTEGGEKITTDNGFVDFLNDVTLKVLEMWEERGGVKIGEHEAEVLKDTLTPFFADRLPETYRPILVRLLEISRSKSKLP